MFKEVKTKSEMEIFNSIWKNNFSKKQYEVEDFEGSASRFLIENEKGEYFGTVELLPYTTDKEKSTVEDMFEFSELDITKQTPIHQIYEIDKLSVLQTEEKKGTLQNILRLLIDFAGKNNIEYYYALINPMLFRALKTTYHFPVEKAGKMVRTEKYSIQPMYIGRKEALEKTDAWYYNYLIEKLNQHVSLK
jgi:hypothetical protein